MPRLACYALQVAWLSVVPCTRHATLQPQCASPCANPIDPNPMPLTPATAPTRETAIVAAHLVRLITDYAVQQGVDMTPLLAEVGWSSATLADSEARLRYSDFAALCERVAQVLGDPLLGLHAGAQVKAGHLGSLGFVLISCATVGEALDRSRRYSGMVMNACSNELEQHGDLCVRYWRSRLPGREPLGRLQDELNMAVWVTLGRWMTGREDFQATWVAFRHPQPAPEQLAAYEALFGCPVTFAQPETAIAIPASVLDWPLPQGNPAVRRMLDALCERTLHQYADRNDPGWLGSVHKAIVQAFEHGGPELGAVAAAAGLRSDELGALLARRGTSFRTLVDTLRQQLALSYIADPSLGLADIAYLLGFSEQSAFQRAFKRWTGKAPGAYRNSAA